MTDKAPPPDGYETHLDAAVAFYVGAFDGCGKHLPPTAAAARAELAALREERTAKDVLVERVWSIIDDVEAQFDVELNASRCFMHRHGWGEFHRGRKGFEHD